VAFVLLFVLITLRYIKYKAVPEPAKPLLCIYAAPLSLCIAGYVQSVTPKSFTFLIAMLAVATVLYIFALIKMLGYLKLPFYPSYAAFTFPFVISAIAAKQTMACAIKLGTPITGLSVLVTIETVIAVVLVVYTYARFIWFIFAKK
jgi:exfoliative toxin A/B